MRDSCGRAWPVTAVAIASVVALALTPTGALASAKSQRIADSVPGIPGLPTGVPPAAETPEPSLPAPSSSEWPFSNDFSHTSGTGLLSRRSEPVDGLRLRRPRAAGQPRGDR